MVIDYGVCENCGKPCAQHDMGDAADCIAAWGVFGDDGQRARREAVEMALRHSPDHGAALALFWQIHYASEDVYCESWPYAWESGLFAAVERDEPYAYDLPTPGDRERMRILRAAAGGWWWARGGDPLFVPGATIAVNAAALVQETPPGPSDTLTR